MPKQRRDWMPRSQGRVEPESRQMWSKYNATHQLREASTMIQLREMSTTRVNKGKVKSNQIRSKYHAHSQLRKMPTMSARPRQRRECQPECQEKVEAKSM